MTDPIHAVSPPSISVLLPVYDGTATLQRAIQSIREQTLADWELIVVNDGSTDGTAKMLADCAAEDIRIRVFTHTRNRGIVSALLTGLEQARAPYIARMDADDLCAPERLEQQRDFLDAHPDIGLVGCRVRFGGDRATHAGYAAYVDWTNTLLEPEEIALNRFVESPFAHPSVAFRRELPECFGSYRDGDFPEDYELWLRWLDAGVRMAKLPDELLTWNDPPGRLSRTDERYRFDAFYRCKALYLARWLEQNNPHHPDIILWGGGRETRKRAEHLCEHGVRITAYIDVDPRRIGQTIHGRPVLAEEQIPPLGESFIVSYVGSRGARDDIRARLLARGLREGIHFLMGA